MKGSLSEDLRVQPGTGSAHVEAKEPTEAVAGEELIGLRTERSATFATDQPGVYATELHTVPVHVRDETGLPRDRVTGWVWVQAA